jgi:dTMP kinase
VIRGRFITLEGGEGVGKTSALTCLTQAIESQGIDLVVTREPGGTALGERLRGLLLGPEAICAEAELMMMFAARIQHVREVIEPALQAGRWVLSDRFLDASYAYQGGGRQVAIDAIRLLESLAVAGLEPDLTLLLDAPVEIGLRRVQERGPSDRFESAGREFLERVRRAYLERAREFPDRIVVVDAARPVDVVRQDLVARLNERCARGFRHHA